MNHSSIVAYPCKLTACAVLASAAFTMSASAADVTVTQEMLLTNPLPPMTVLDHDGSGDWTSVGTTQTAGRIQDLAHLNDDGELVLVDDAGFQYHAVWAASRPVTPTMNWQVSFRYIPVPNPDTRYYDAGGWTFVMQNTGSTAYGTTSALLGAPAGSYGFMFHRYFLGVRWIKNSNSIPTQTDSDWTHIIATNRHATSIAYTEGLDLDMTNAMDVTIGCTSRVWTVTMRQEGKETIVLSHDFSDIIADNGTPYYLGFTGSSSWWNKNDQFPVMYQKIANVAGEIDTGTPPFVAAGSAYALGESTWKLLEHSEFVSDGRLLVLDPYTATGNRCFGGVGQSPLYRKLPFTVSFEWECEKGTNGAQGVSFSLVPSSEPQNGSSQGGTDFFYPGEANAAGFYLRPYNSEGFGWHKAGVRTSASTSYNVKSGDVLRVKADWNGDSRMIVTLQRNAGTVTVRTNTFDNLPDVFYPAFHGATAYYSDGPTRFVAQNYAMKVLNNSNPARLGDRIVTGAQEYVLSTWSADAYFPSAVAGTLTMGTDAALTLSPDTNGLGGSLFASNIEVCATSGIAARSPCATVLSRLSYPVDATLALTGRAVAAADPVTVWCAKDAFRPGRHLLLDATGATGLEGSSFVLAEGADAIPRDRCRLEWNGETLVLVVKGGLLILFR